MRTWGGPNPNVWCPYKRKERAVDVQGDESVRTDAGTGVWLLQAKECRIQEAGRDKEGFSLRAFGGSCHLDFNPLAPRAVRK